MLTRKTAQGIIRDWAHASLHREDASAEFDFLLSGFQADKRDLVMLHAERAKFISQLSTHTVKVTLGSAKQDWLTPPYFLDLVRRVGPIALDPCANPRSFVNAWTSLYWPWVDGLSVRWYVPENTVCFVNPPYGRTLHLWANKMAADGPTIITNANANLISLIPARTGTGYWEQYIWPFADAVCFWHGGTQHPSRMCFYGLDGRPADQGATFDAAVVYFGKQRERFKSVFESYGTVQLCN
jgi:hypothetical protein